GPLTGQVGGLLENASVEAPFRSVQNSSVYLYNNSEPLTAQRIGGRGASGAPCPPRSSTIWCPRTPQRTRRWRTSPTMTTGQTPTSQGRTTRWGHRPTGSNSPCRRGRIATTGYWGRQARTASSGRSSPVGTGRTLRPTRRGFRSMSPGQRLRSTPTPAPDSCLPCWTLTGARRQSDREDVSIMVTPAKAITRLKAFARTRKGAGAIRQLATLWGVLAIGAGVIIPAFAVPNASDLAFHTTFTLVSPPAWGLIYIGIGAAVLVTVYSRADLAPYPLFVLGSVVALMGLTTSGSFVPIDGDGDFGDGGAPLITWLLVVLAIAIFIVGSAVDIPRKGRHDA